MDLAPEPREGLGELAADGPGPDHREPSGKVGKVEDGFVGEISEFREAGSIGHSGARPGCDACLGEMQGCSVDVDGTRSGEARSAEINIDAQGVEALRGV